MISDEESLGEVEGGEVNETVMRIGAGGFADPPSPEHSRSNLVRSPFGSGASWSSITAHGSSSTAESLHPHDTRHTMITPRPSHLNQVLNSESYRNNYNSDDDEDENEDDREEEEVPCSWTGGSDDDSLEEDCGRNEFSGSAGLVEEPTGTDSGGQDENETQIIMRPKQTKLGDDSTTDHGLAKSDASGHPPAVHA